MRYKIVFAGVNTFGFDKKTCDNYILKNTTSFEVCWFFVGKYRVFYLLYIAYPKAYTSDAVLNGNSFS